MIMENVEGLLLGEAWTYVQRIYKELKAAGYQVKHWLCKGEHMGIPQKRHRVFFVALRNDIAFDLESLDMSFNYEPVTYGETTYTEDNKEYRLAKFKYEFEDHFNMHYSSMYYVFILYILQYGVHRTC